MGVYKNEKNKTWYFKSTYKDFTGKTKYVTRRGFATKAEVKLWNSFLYLLFTEKKIILMIF